MCTLPRMQSVHFLRWPGPGRCAPSGDNKTMPCPSSSGWKCIYNAILVFDMTISILKGNVRSWYSLRRLVFGILFTACVIFSISFQVRRITSKTTSCTNGVKLKYFDQYSELACREDCQARQYVAKCRCRKTSRWKDDGKVHQDEVPFPSEKLPRDWLNLLANMILPVPSYNF